MYDYQKARRCTHFMSLQAWLSVFCLFAGIRSKICNLMTQQWWGRHGRLHFKNHIHLEIYNRNEPDSEIMSYSQPTINRYYFEHTAYGFQRTRSMRLIMIIWSKFRSAYHVKMHGHSMRAIDSKTYKFATIHLCLCTRVDQFRCLN